MPDSQELGALAVERDYCPSAMADEAIDCRNADRAPLVKLSSEIYGESSRCFNMIDKNPACLESICDETAFALQITAGNKTYTCLEEDDGKALPLPGGDGSFVCPKLSTVCPE
jgi:hypothetical protein